MMPPYVFPHYLFSRKEKRADKGDIPRIIKMVEDKIREDRIEGEEKRIFIEKINLLFGNKFGKDWTDIKN